MLGQRCAGGSDCAGGLTLPAGFRFGHPRLAAGSTFTFTVLGGAAGPKTVHPATPVTLASDFSITFTTAPGIAP